MKKNNIEFATDCNNKPITPAPLPNNITEIVFILDRSGSMAGLEKDTIGGFNAMIEKQKKEDGLAYVSTVLFDNTSEVIHDRVPLHQMTPMTEDDYYVRGCTALLDAIGGAIKHISNVHRYARLEDVPAKTLFVITTDGMENASRHYTAEKVKTMIKNRKDGFGWEFLFLGANIDAVEAAGRIGIDHDRAVDYKCDARGTALNYEAVGSVVKRMRSGSAKAFAGWKDEIEKDVEKRGR